MMINNWFIKRFKDDDLQLGNERFKDDDYQFDAYMF